MKHIQHYLLRNTLFRAVGNIRPAHLRLIWLALTVITSIVAGTNGGPEGGGTGTG